MEDDQRAWVKFYRASVVALLTLTCGILAFEGNQIFDSINDLHTDNQKIWVILFDHEHRISVVEARTK